MKRLHVHVGVRDLDAGIRFYNALFCSEPVKVKPDYAKWMLDDPRVNFAISTRPGRSGVDHLGIQVDADEDLADLRENFVRAGIATHDDGETTCCYARSEKSWVKDPDGVAWETFHTMDDADIPAASGERVACCSDEAHSSACCAP